MARDADPSRNSLLLQRFPHLHLVSNTAKGRGVFASALILAGTIIDISPVLVLGIEENIKHIEHTSLYHYTYNWPTISAEGTPQKSQAVVLGLGSMFNHSTQNQNVGWKRDLDREVIVYRALNDIAKGEELCISYGDHLTFVDAEASTPSEPEDEVEMLGRIDV
ncbi:SET domain-containing protein 7 [Pseudocercospora fuligena]|uniref:SET domain-containing protein 7 n=1 Tax=Pseudocercospora fuligena TaxID=685502 RepID=A0A8H6VJA4_9PEZI|nr:SET domain-containing protein 7 [Pseudocercospora fuligena]